MSNTPPAPQAATVPTAYSAVVKPLSLPSVRRSDLIRADQLKFEVISRFSHVELLVPLVAFCFSLAAIGCLDAMFRKTPLRTPATAAGSHAHPQ